MHRLGGAGSTVGWPMCSRSPGSCGQGPDGGWPNDVFWDNPGAGNWPQDIPQVLRTEVTPLSPVCQNAGHGLHLPVVGVPDSPKWRLTRPNGTLIWRANSSCVMPVSARRRRTAEAQSSSSSRMSHSCSRRSRPPFSLHPPTCGFPCTALDTTNSVCQNRPMTYPGTKLEGVDEGPARPFADAPPPWVRSKPPSSTSPLLVLARTRAGDCFALRVLSPVVAVAVACQWVRENPGLVIEVVRA